MGGGGRGRREGREKGVSEGEGEGRREGREKGVMAESIWMRGERRSVE